MIPLTGLSSLAGLNLVEATRDRQIESIKNSAQGLREVAAFRERIGDIETVDQLLDDRELYVFVMKTYDLEDQIFGKAMMSKVLKSDPEDPESLVNILTDQRFKDLHSDMGFLPDDAGNLNTLLTSWQDDMVDRFLERQFINNQADQNATIGVALEFRRQVGSIEDAFDFLKDADMASFIKTALGIPESSGQDIDSLAELIEKKLDFSKLSDPAEVDKLILRYVSIQDANNSTNTASNIAVQMMSAAVNASASGSFVPITIDIEAISQKPIGSYG